MAPKPKDCPDNFHHDYITHTGAVPNDLLNEIHSLFRRDRWLCLESVDYYRLTPVLRLASLMLQSPASLAYICALIDSPRVRLDMTAPHDLYSFRRVDYDEVKTKARALDFLRKLTPYVKYRLHDREPEKETILGETFRLSNDNPITMEGFSCSGSRSFIYVKPSHVECIRDLVEQPVAHAFPERNPEVECDILRLQFYVALTLCHETIHACSMALSPQTVIEPFYEDERLNELGLSWTQAVFSAIPNNCSPQYLGEELDATKFPSIFHLPNTELRQYARRGRKKTSTVYYIPMQYVSDIQQRAFWPEGPGGGHDMKKLLIPKIFGRRYRYTGKDLDPDWDKDDSSEGYPSNRRGFVTRPWSGI